MSSELPLKADIAQYSVGMSQRCQWRQHTCRQWGGAAAHRQLQALLLGRGERGLRELNNVGFGVAPTARAWQRGGRVEASTRRTPRGWRGTLEHHGSMQSFDHSGIQTLNFGCGENCQYETAASQWLACSNSSSSNRRTHGVYATG